MNEKLDLRNRYCSLGLIRSGDLNHSHELFYLPTGDFGLDSDGWGVGQTSDCEIHATDFTPSEEAAG